MGTQAGFLGLEGQLDAPVAPQASGAGLRAATAILGPQGPHANRYFLLPLDVGVQALLEVQNVPGCSPTPCPTTHLAERFPHQEGPSCPPGPRVTGHLSPSSLTVLVWSSLGEKSSSSASLVPIPLRSVGKVSRARVRGPGV